MTAIEFAVTNRNGLKIRGQVDIISEGRPLALVLHGLGDRRQAPVVRSLCDGLVRGGYNVATWDATNSVGSSEGSVEFATLGGKLSDLKDVYAWLKDNGHIDGPIMLAGHSMGGAAALRFAVERPEAVSGLLLAAPFVSGPRIARRISRLGRAVWRLRGHVSVKSLGGRRYRYGLLQDALRYDGLSLAPRLSMPVRVMAAANDTLLPLGEQRLLFEALPHHLRSLEVIEGASHLFKEQTSRVESVSYGFARTILEPHYGAIGVYGGSHGSRPAGAAG